MDTKRKYSIDYANKNKTKNLDTEWLLFLEQLGTKQ